MALEPYTTVRLLTNRYQDRNVSAGDIGVILEVYDDEAYEVEFSGKDGTTIAWFAVQQDEVMLYEPKITYKYNGYLRFKPLSEPQLRRGLELIGMSNSTVKIGVDYLEIAYADQDVSQEIIQLLQSLAEIIQNAVGEIICAVENESADSEFEFYFIKQGKLFRQKGRILREKVEAVGMQMPIPSI